MRGCMIIGNNDNNYGLFLDTFDNKINERQLLICFECMATFFYLPSGKIRWSDLDFSPKV